MSVSFQMRFSLSRVLEGLGFDLKSGPHSTRLPQKGRRVGIGRNGDEYESLAWSRCDGQASILTNRNVMRVISISK